MNASATRPSGGLEPGLLIVALVWGSNFAVIKVALGQIDPSAFVLARFILAAGLLCLLVLLSGESLELPRSDWPAAIALGLVGHAAYQMAFTQGLALTSSGHGALILGLVPACVALIVGLTGMERLPLRCWGGVGLSLAGTAMVVLGGDPSGAASLRGDILVFLAMIAWASYTVFSKPLLARHSPLKLTALTMAVGALGIAPASARAFLAQDWESVSVGAWLAYLSATLLGLVLAYILWFRGIRRIGSARTAVYSNLVPVVGLIVGWIFLAERLSPAQWLGAAAVIVGVWMAQQRGRGADPG